MSKLFKSGAFSLILMIVLSLITQVVTLLKTSIVAGIFGTSLGMDAFSFSNSIVVFIFGFVSAGLSTVIIPRYVKGEEKKYTDSFITIIYSVLAFVVLFTIVGRHALIGFLSNKEDQFVGIASYIIVPLIIASFFLSVADISIAFFQCKEHYNLPKLINLISQSIVVVLLWFKKDISIYEYVLIISLGMILNFGFDVFFALRLGWRYRPTFDFKSPETKAILKLFIPIIFSTGVYQISLMVDSVIATRLSSGFITVLSYSNMIAAIVNTVLIGNLMNYCYPRIVRIINQKNNQEIFWSETAAFHMIMCLIVVGFFNVGREAVYLLFYRGNFSLESANYVYIGAAIYIFGLQIDIIRNFVYRYFYAKGNTSTAAHNSIIVSVLNIVVSLILVSIIGFYGIIIGTVIASLFSLSIILYQFSKKIGFDVDFKKVILSLLKNVLLIPVVFYFVNVSKQLVSITNNILSILIFGIETVVLFLALTIVINKSTIDTIRSLK